MTATNKTLTARYNELSGKSIKVGSYSLSRLAGMIRDLERAAEVAAAEAAAAAAKPAKKPRTPKPSTPTSNDTFTLSELARDCGISPKIARARYRAVSNDHVRTYYIFDRTTKELDRVLNIISPKR